jgi:hypothetical protein
VCLSTGDSVGEEDFKVNFRVWRLRDCKKVENMAELRDEAYLRTRRRGSSFLLVLC